MGNLNRKRTQILFNSVDSSSLTYTNATLDTLAVKDYNIFGEAGTTLRKFKKSTTSAGIKQVVVITPDFAYPSDTTGYEWYLNVKPKTDLRQGRADRAYLADKTYQGVTGALAAASGGKIADADEVKLIDSMVANINSDPYAPVVASRAGLTSAAGLHLILVAKTASIKFDVSLEAMYGAITQNGGLQASGADGATAVATAVLTSAGSSFTVDALIGMYLIITDSASSNFGLRQIITDNDATTITKGTNFGYLETTLDFIVVGGSAAYPVLTLEDVQKVFPIKPMDAGRSAELFPSAAYTSWCKYFFRIERSGVQGAYALDGANHLDAYIEEVEIYVPETLAEATNGVNWDDKIYDWLTGISYVDPNGDSTPWGLSHN